MSAFTHDISIVATIAGLDPIEVYATQTIADVEHFSRGVIDDANPEIPGTTGGVAGNRPDFLFVVAKGDEVKVELDNGDDMDVSLLKGQTFGMLSGKTFTRTTDAGDTAVSSDAVGLNTVVGGRGNTFEYLAVTKEVQSPCELSEFPLFFDIGGPTPITFLGQTTSGYYAAYQDGQGAVFPVGNEEDAGVPIGESCVFPCDINGNPTGSWLAVYVLPLFTDPGDSLSYDFSSLDGQSLTGSIVGTSGGDPASLLFIDDPNTVSLQIPNLTNPNTGLEINNINNLESVSIPPGVRFGFIFAGGFSPTFQVSSVDALCNALDPTATGQVSSICFDTGPAPTAASLANRLAYLVNNTLDVFP